MAAVWRFILATPAGVERGEVFRAASRKISLPLNGMPTVTWSMTLDNPMVDVILGATEADRINLLLKAYRNGRLVFVGPLISAQETVNGADQTLDVGAAGPLWRLLSRLVGRSTAGYGDGDPLNLKDLAAIVLNLLDATNGDSDTGIRRGAQAVTTNSYVTGYYFKKVGEAIAELTQGTLGGPDFRVTPVEPVADAAGVQIATLDTFASLGQQRDNVVFEYGTGRHNVNAYTRPITRDGEINRAYHLPPGFPDAVAAGDGVVVSSDAASIAARGLREDVVTADLATIDLRQKLVDEHVRIRKVPRETVVFTPSPDVAYELGVDYDVGDLVPARAVVNGSVRFDAYFRLYGVDFSVDDMGVESLDLTLLPGS